MCLYVIACKTRLQHVRTLAMTVRCYEYYIFAVRENSTIILTLPLCSSTLPGFKLSIVFGIKPQTQSPSSALTITLGMALQMLLGPGHKRGGNVLLYFQSNRITMRPAALDANFSVSSKHNRFLVRKDSANKSYFSYLKDECTPVCIGLIQSANQLFRCLYQERIDGVKGSAIRHW